MIIFTITFNTTYVESLFNNCLPSLFAGFNQNEIKEPLQFRVYTTPEHQREIERQLKTIPLESSVIVGTKDENNNNTATGLLNSAIIDCLRIDQSFVFAPPDLIYSPGALNYGWRLHRMTGKTVALFNGRVNAKPTTILAPSELLDFFLFNADPMWQIHTTTNSEVLAGALNGHMVYNGVETIVFCSVPNPFIGKFKPEDVYLLRRGVRAWDHEWGALLAEKKLLLPQTDLLSGFTIEPDPPGKFRTEHLESFLHQPERRAKFAGDVYCFHARRT